MEVTERKCPTYKERRERLIENVVSGYSEPFSRALAEVMMLPPEYDLDPDYAEGLATALAYSRLMRGRHNNSAASMFHSIQLETLQKWKDAIDAERKRRIDVIRKYNPAFKFTTEPYSDEHIGKAAAQVLEVEEIKQRADEAYYQAIYEFRKSLGTNF